MLVWEVKAEGVIVGRGIIEIVLEAVTDTFDFATAFVVRAREVRFHLFNGIIVHGFEGNSANCNKWTILSLPLGLSQHVS